MQHRAYLACVSLKAAWASHSVAHNPDVPSLRDSDMACGKVGTVTLHEGRAARPAGVPQLSQGLAGPFFLISLHLSRPSVPSLCLSLSPVTGPALLVRRGALELQRVA